MDSDPQLMVVPMGLTMSPLVTSPQPAAGNSCGTPSNKPFNIILPKQLLSSRIPKHTSIGSCGCLGEESLC